MCINLQPLGGNLSDIAKKQTSMLLLILTSDTESGSDVIDVWRRHSTQRPLNLANRDLRFSLKLGQIGTKWDKFGT